MHVTITGGGMIGLTSAYQMARGGAIARAPGSFFRDWTSTTDPRVGAGVRPMTPDGLPIMGKLPNLENAWVSTGHAMLGITLAPASATAIADLILHSRRSPTLDSFAPDRFLRGSRRNTA